MKPLTVFEQMIAELEAQGWTVHKITEEVTRRAKSYGMSVTYTWTQLNRVANGGRVAYPLDFLIAELHTAECGGSILTIVPRSPTIMMTSA